MQTRQSGKKTAGFVATASVIKKEELDESSDDSGATQLVSRCEKIQERRQTPRKDASMSRQKQLRISKQLKTEVKDEITDSDDCVVKDEPGKRPEEVSTKVETISDAEEQGKGKQKGHARRVNISMKKEFLEVKQKSDVQVPRQRVKREVKVDLSKAKVKSQPDLTKEEPAVLKKRTRKQSNMTRSDFLDFEAHESDGGKPDRVKTDADYMRETYAEEELGRKTRPLQDVVEQLQEKYKIEQDFKNEELIENDVSLDENELMDIDADGNFNRGVSLPSNQDSKLWRLKVKEGMERQLVMRLTNKLINQFNSGHPLMVMQVFESENTAGVIFVEAYKLSHVEQLTRGMAGIYSRGLRMIPIAEMTEVMKACSAMKESPVVPHQWVRVTKGAFDGDLGLIEQVFGAKEALVRLIPRIPDFWFGGSDSQGPAGVPQTFRGLDKLVKNQRHVKIPQRLFNPQQVKNEARLEHSRALGKKVYVWKELSFRNGFLYHKLPLSKFAHENVCPMLDEVRRFQLEMSHGDEFGGYSSDIDEWDVLKNETLLKTVRNDTQLQIQVGDRCEVFYGQFRGCKGSILEISESQVCTMHTLDKIPVKIKVAAKELQKFFEQGESVRILQGIHAGEPGQILEVQSEGTHALVLMENTKGELKVLVSNLRRDEGYQAHKRDSLAEFFGPIGRQNAVPKSVSEVYNVGDLVLFDNLASFGYILQIQPDSLKVLLPSNATQMVKLAHVSRKIAFETRGISGRHCKRPPVVTDRYHNTVTMRTLVKPIDKDLPFFGDPCEVRAIYKDTLYVLVQKSSNMHKVGWTNGIFAAQRNQVVNSGFELIDEAFAKANEGADDQCFQQGKLDKRLIDKRAFGQTIFVSRGPLKGYKGKIVYADEVSATVQIFAKGNQTVTLPRDFISLMSDSSAPLRMQADAPMAISFDEAMNQEFVNAMLDEDGNPIVPTEQVDRQDLIAESLGTPRGSPTLQTDDGWGAAK